MNLLISFFFAFLFNYFTTPVLIKYAIKYGWSVKPRNDRWHTNTTALFGGVTIFLSIIISIFFAKFLYNINLNSGFIISLILFFILGFIDDIYELNSKSKFFFQILISFFFLLTTKESVQIFSYPVLNYLLSVLWILLITNSSNLLDNMDGLLSGIIFTITLFLTFSFIFLSNNFLAILSCIISGSTLSFLYFNFKPAKIFMGDCGSLTLGFSISALTLYYLNQNIISNNFSFIFLPIFIAAPLLLDVTLVIIKRLISGRKIYIGGKDHISHRLVFWGFTETTAVKLIYVLTFLWNFLSFLILTRFNYSLLYFLLFFLFFSTLFLGYILSDLKVYSTDEEITAYNNIRGLSSWFKKHPFFIKFLLNKKIIIVNIFDTISHIFIILILSDFFNIYFEINVLIFYLTLKLSISNILKFHKISWRNTSVVDIFKIFYFNIIIFVFFYFISYQQKIRIEIILLDMILSFNFLVFLRLSYKFIHDFLSRLRQNRNFVIIYGAGKSGILISKELLSNRKYNMFPLYFIDDDILKSNSYSNNIKILNPAINNIQNIFIENNVKTLIISSSKIESTRIENFEKLIKSLNVKILKFDFNLTEIK